MKYRQFGSLDWKVSALGFGAMRLPLAGTRPEDIDEAQAIRMLHYAIDHGLNYVDTAWAYHNEASEPLVGRALRGAYRQKVHLATKLPCWLVETAADFDKYLNEQLRRLDTDHVDFYLLHSLSGDSWRKMRDLGVLRWSDGAIQDGRIGHLGFSFHDEYAVFQEIVDAWDGWTFCQIQYNFAEPEYQAGRKGLAYAASRGLAVVIMEPLLGGRLANPPARIQDVWASSRVERSPVDWALQWLWNQPEVSVVLSGMSSLQHVQENVASAERSGAHTLTEDDMAILARLRAMYEDLCPIPCTRCGYCMPCPSDVAIPDVLGTFNRGRMHDDWEGARASYKWIEEAQRADRCTQCLECEEVCPQHIPVSQWMEVVDQVLAHGKDYAACRLPS